MKFSDHLIFNHLCRLQVSGFREKFTRLRSIASILAFY
ncbi:hypothetical protein D1AOALGA4SA_8819 [Olavius algarvensis Delta 1 endosymbiont]|nr:hypothetical protein D1AOALGA4SA_8819 [Olavius algarvensis Delta 1 endosymbiont]